MIDFIPIKPNYIKIDSARAGMFANTNKNELTERTVCPAYHPDVYVWLTWWHRIVSWTSLAYPSSLTPELLRLLILTDYCRSYDWTSAQQHFYLSQDRRELDFAFNHRHLQCIEPILQQLQRGSDLTPSPLSTDSGLLKLASRVASSCFSQQHSTLKSHKHTYTEMKKDKHTRSVPGFGQALQMATSEVSQGANPVVNCTSILKNTLCSCCFLISRQRALYDLYFSLSKVQTIDCM